jgi:hypothetical protein
MRGGRNISPHFFYWKGGLMDNYPFLDNAPNGKGRYSRSLPVHTIPKYAATKIQPEFCIECPKYPCLLAHNSSIRPRICPCGKCILKAMCEKQCEDFKYLSNDLFKINLSYDYRKGKYPY